MEEIRGLTMRWIGLCGDHVLHRLPVAAFTKEVDPRLAKRPLKTNGRLANHGLISLVKEAEGVPPGRCLGLSLHCMQEACTMIGSSTYAWKRTATSGPSSGFIEINTLLQICVITCLILMFCGNDMPQFDLVCWSAKWILASTARILVTTDYSTYLLYSFLFNSYIAQEQIPYSAVTMKRVAVTNNKVTATMNFVHFYQWSHTVSINQRGALLSIWRKLVVLISPRKGTLIENMKPVVHTYC